MPPQKNNSIDLSAGLVPAQTPPGGSAPPIDLSAGLTPNSSAAQQPQQQPGMRQQVDSYLNNTEGNGAIVRGLKGVGRVAAGLVELPVDALKPPQTPDESGVYVGAGGGATGQIALAMKRFLYDPAAANVEKAKNDFSEHHYSEGIGHGAAAALPLVGPWAASMGERAGQGDLVGTATEFGAGLAIPKAAGKVVGRIAKGMERVSAPLSDTVSNARGSVPAEAATPAELQSYANANNIPVNAAQLTEHNLPRGLQSTGERALVGGTDIKKGVKASQAAIGAHVDQLMDQMSPSRITPDTATAGNALKGNIESALEREKTLARGNFDSIDRKANGVAVDARPLKQLAGIISDQNKFSRENTPSMNPPRATKIVRDIQNLPDQVSFKDAQNLRSDLLDETRHPDNLINEKAQGWLKQLSSQTDQSMMDAAVSKPGLEQDFRRANDHWKGLEEDFNSPRSPLYQAAKEPIPERVTQKFMQQGSTGGAPTVVRMLQKYGIDTGPLKREVLRDIAEGKGFKLYRGRDLGGYDHNYLQSLFTPQELDSIHKTGSLARSVDFEANPSRSGTILSEAEQVQKPVRSLIPKTAAAKLTLSPTFNQRMMRSTPTPAVGSIANAMRKVSPRAMRGGVAAAMSERNSQ